MVVESVPETDIVPNEPTVMVESPSAQILDESEPTNVPSTGKEVWTGPVPFPSSGCASSSPAERSVPLPRVTARTRSTVDPYEIYARRCDTLPPTSPQAISGTLPLEVLILGNLRPTLCLLGRALRQLPVAFQPPSHIPSSVHCRPSLLRTLGRLEGDSGVRGVMLQLQPQILLAQFPLNSAALSITADSTCSSHRIRACPRP